jgi:hypothetical protein
MPNYRQGYYRLGGKPLDESTRRAEGILTNRCLDWMSTNTELYNVECVLNAKNVFTTPSLLQNLKVTPPSTFSFPPTDPRQGPRESTHALKLGEIGTTTAVECFIFLTRVNALRNLGTAALITV